MRTGYSASRKLGKFLLALCLVGAPVGLAVAGWLYLARHPEKRAVLPIPQQFLPPAPLRLERPYGMAPVAFAAYVRACNNAKIHPFRIGQTIGDHPRSVGYHKRDGVIVVNGQREEYCAAIDLGTWDLEEARINRFVRELGKQGFAAWYRHGPNWKNGEHIHAVYAFLPMKRQLRGQVLSYLREERTVGRPVRWERKMRRSRAWRKYLS
jgi:hypothetical protein